MLFAFIHEIGHLIIGILLGFKPMSINITPYGLQIEFKIHCEEYNKKIRKDEFEFTEKGLNILNNLFLNYIQIVLHI